MIVRVTVTGRRYDVANAIPAEFDLPEGTTLELALARLRDALPDDGQLPAACMVAVSGVHLGTLAAHEDRELVDGDEIMLVAPVAGG